MCLWEILKTANRRSVIPATRNLKCPHNVSNKVLDVVHRNADRQLFQLKKTRICRALLRQVKWRLQAGRWRRGSHRSSPSRWRASTRMSLWRGRWGRRPAAARTGTAPTAHPGTAGYCTVVNQGEVPLWPEISQCCINVLYSEPCRLCDHHK